MVWFGGHWRVRNQDARTGGRDCPEYLSRVDAPHPDVSNETSDTSVRATIDIVVGVLLVFVGIAGVVSGGMISVLADRDEIAALVEDEVLVADGISDADLIELIHGLLLWGGFALSAAGAVILLGTIAFVALRWRSHRHGRPYGSLYADGVVGAVVTLVTSFVPFSPLVGGIAAGYLSHGDRWHGARVGVVVGLLVAIPVIVFGAVLAAGYADIGLVWASLIVVFVAVTTGIMTLLFAAVGGYVGGYLRTEHCA